MISFLHDTGDKDYYPLAFALADKASQFTQVNHCNGKPDLAGLLDADRWVNAQDTRSTSMQQGPWKHYVGVVSVSESRHEMLGFGLSDVMAALNDATVHKGFVGHSLFNFTQPGVGICMGQARRGG